LLTRLSLAGTDLSTALLLRAIAWSEFGHDLRRYQTHDVTAKSVFCVVGSNPLKVILNINLNRRDYSVDVMLVMCPLWYNAT